ncbi:hypothetical protein [Arthrobacter sp. CP30]
MTAGTGSATVISGRSQVIRRKMALSPRARSAIITTTATKWPITIRGAAPLSMK